MHADQSALVELCIVGPRGVPVGCGRAAAYEVEGRLGLLSSEARERRVLCTLREKGAAARRGAQPAPNGGLEGTGSARGRRPVLPRLPAAGSPGKVTAGTAGFSPTQRVARRELSDRFVLESTTRTTRPRHGRSVPMPTRCVPRTPVLPEASRRDS
ncbi:hypothetical protein DIPPA_35962 [Diplonema papillatum]|nr:hypothetical protein DIPPA_35962 [Diplonema papillatum]